MKMRFFTLGLLMIGMLAGYFVYPRWGIPDSLNVPFRLGLDLKGGIHLMYRADLSQIESAKRGEALEGLRDVVERRVNFFGVAEPVVRTERAVDEDRLSVQLAGIFDTATAIQLIGETPYLEFKKINPDVSTTTLEANPLAGWTATELTGRYLKTAAMEFDPTTGIPSISITFDDEGAKHFENLTADNIGKPIAIFLDGVPISAPTVQAKITGGKAQITGNFTREEALMLARRLNSGALPVPISLISQEQVEPSRGAEALSRSFFAGLVGFGIVVLFMIFWYRLPGLLAVFALGIYISLSLAIFKIIPITLTNAGIAGVILSIGMAVDANVLIFERLKEELRRGRTLTTAIEEGFNRAWTSVRDSNTSSLITSLILWYFGTDAVKGFALTLGLGIIVSMFTAIVVTRTFLRATHGRKYEAGHTPFLYGSGFRLN